MRKTHIIALTLLGLSFFAASCGGSKHASKKVVAGTWQAQPIVIDGANQDWPSPYPSYDADAMIGYATSNDKDNLYITMETGDEYTQMKVLKAGMMVWIDTGGGKTVGMGIHYPMPSDETNPLEIEAHKEGERPSNKETDLSKGYIGSKVKKSIQDANQLTLEGFGKCNGGFLVSQKNECGISVHIGMDEYGELIWEAVVPFKTLYNKEHISQRDAGKPISVCFAIKSFKKPSTTGGSSSDQSTGMSNGGGRGGGMGSGGGGMGGGGMRGGGGGSRGGKGGRGSNATNPRDKLFESSKTWKHFGLAYQ